MPKERSGREDKLLEQQRLREQREEALLYAWVEQAHREGLEEERDKAERRARRAARRAAKAAKKAAKKAKRRGTHDDPPLGLSFQSLWQACGVRATAAVTANHEG